MKIASLYLIALMITSCGGQRRVGDPQVEIVKTSGCSGHSCSSAQKGSSTNKAAEANFNEDRFIKERFQQAFNHQYVILVVSSSQDIVDYLDIMYESVEFESNGFTKSSYAKPFIDEVKRHNQDLKQAQNLKDYDWRYFGTNSHEEGAKMAARAIVDISRKAYYYVQSSTLSLAQGLNKYVSDRIAINTQLGMHNHIDHEVYQGFFMFADQH